MAQQRFQGVGNRCLLADEQLGGLLQPAALHERLLLRLPARRRLLLAEAQQPLRVLPVAFALAQVHLDEAPHHQRVDHGHFGPGRDQVVSHGQVVGARGFEHVQAGGPAAAHQFAEARRGIGYVQVVHPRIQLVLYRS